jgi:hypothetical protein
LRRPFLADLFLALFLSAALTGAGTVALVAYRFGWDCIQVGMQPGADGIGDVCRERGYNGPGQEDE